MKVKELCPYWSAKGMHLYVAHQCDSHEYVEYCHGCGSEK